MTTQTGGISGGITNGLLLVQAAGEIHVYSSADMWHEPNVVIVNYDSGDFFDTTKHNSNIITVHDSKHTIQRALSALEACTFAAAAAASIRSLSEKHFPPFSIASSKILFRQMNHE